MRPLVALLLCLFVEILLVEMINVNREPGIFERATKVTAVE
jgi:hypothetical protein